MLIFTLIIKTLQVRLQQRLLWVVALCSCFATVQAGVVISGTRVIYPANEKEITVTLTNVEQTPSLVQAWLDDGNEQSTPEETKVPFVLTPPVFRMEAGNGQKLRILYTGEPLPIDRESLFFLNVLDIPPKPDNAENYFQFSVRSRLKLFFRPTGLKPTIFDAAKKLQLTLSGNSLLIENPTPYYITPTTVKLLGQSEQVLNEVPMLAPFSQVSVNAMGAQGVVKTAIISYINDFGGIGESRLPVR